MERIPTRSSRGLLRILLLAGLTLASAVNGQQNVGFDKAFTPSTIGPGSVSTLQFNIENFTSSGARGLMFTDSLPAGVTIASPAKASSTCGGTVTAPDGGGTITFDAGGVGAGSTCTVTVDVTSSTVGTHTNTSSDLTSDLGTSSPATADLTVEDDRPGFSKSFLPSAVAFGGRSILTFTIDNTANTAGAANLSFTDNMPIGLEVASPTDASTTCSGGTLTATAGGGVISYGPSFFGDASVAAGSSCTVTVEVVGNNVGRIDNVTEELTSTPQAGGAARSSGKASATLIVTFDQISLSKRFVGDPVNPGGTVDLEFTVSNLNRRSSATGITFTDDLDATLSGLVATGLPLTNPCGSGSSLSGSSLLTLTGGNLGPEGSCTFTVTLQVPSGAAAGTYVNTTSAISATIDGGSVSGNPAADVLVVDAGLVFTKTFIPDIVGAGDSIELEFVITNTAGSAATEITFEDEFVEELPTASSVPADGFCGEGSTATYTPLIDSGGGGSILAKLVVSGASLGPGDSCTFSLILDVWVNAATNTYFNTTSEITATVDGETVVGGTASDDFALIAAPALLKEFTDDPAQPGGTVTLAFTLVHDENAPGDAVNITFTDDLDATLTGLVATGLPASDVCGVGSQLTGTSTLTFSGGTLVPGDSCTFNVTLDVPSDAPAGKHTNTTSTVMADVLDIDTLAGAASDDLSIAGLVLTKEFTDDPVLPGGTVTLRYTIENTSPVSDATDIFMEDDLDAALDNMMATGLPASDVCGSGSSLDGFSGDRLIQLTGGNLVAGDSCTFDVTLDVPASAADDVYGSSTSLFTAKIDGTPVVFDNAFDELVVASDFLALAKEFTDDPASPGDTVNLRFTLTNLHDSLLASNIAFTDDLDAALAGLAAVGLPASVCGGTASGTGTISFTGGSLASGASCSFDVTLQVPSAVPLGTIATNTTSEVTGTIDGLGVTGSPASDDLRIDFLTFSKSFSGDAAAGGTVVLSFTLQNLSASDGVIELSFTDDLDATLSGLVATGLPASDVCGEGSELSGTSFLSFTGGILLPGGSCTFTVSLQVPASADPGSYLNVTSDLFQGSAPAAAPATATLTVTAEPVDSDNDGVLDNLDVCLGTTIPEGVPTQELGKNRWALVDGDTVFDTNPPNGNGPKDSFTTTDTAGCSCEQIIEALGLGQGHVKFGCSIGVMRTWVNLVN